MTRNGSIWLGVVLLGTAVWSAMAEPAQQSAGEQPESRGNAVIVNSGSTNRAGFRLAVERGGQTARVETRRGPRLPPAEGAAPARVAGHVPAPVAEKLFADLEAAWPIASLPAAHCAKSASFGSRLTIEFGGQSTPDLSCPATDHKVRALADDAREAVSRNRTESETER